MASLNEPIAKRIGTLIRKFSTKYPNERHIASDKLDNLLVAEGLSFNDLATVIENCNGEIEELKYSDADMANVADRMKERGTQEGYDKAKREMMAPPEFYDDSGNPRWYEIAVFCDSNKTRLRNNWEEDFITDMPSKMMRYGEPSAKQAKIILGIFVRLGGVVPPEIRLRYV
jgi:hypothetical protein